MTELQIANSRSKRVSKFTGMFNVERQCYPLFPHGLKKHALEQSFSGVSLCIHAQHQRSKR